MQDFRCSKKTIYMRNRSDKIEELPMHFHPWARRAADPTTWETADQYLQSIRRVECPSEPCKVFKAASESQNLISLEMAMYWTSHQRWYGLSSRKEKREGRPMNRKWHWKDLQGWSIRIQCLILKKNQVRKKTTQETSQGTEGEAQDKDQDALQPLNEKIHLNNKE